MQNHKYTQYCLLLVFNMPKTKLFHANEINIKKGNMMKVILVIDRSVCHLSHNHKFPLQGQNLRIIQVVVQSLNCV